MKNPIQPILVVNGILRFKENAVVRYLLDSGGINMNDIALRNFSKDDQQQFAQLIGYSLSGYSELRNYVTDEAYSAAVKFANDYERDKDAQIAALQEELTELRASLKPAIARLYGLHVDDLSNNDA